MLKCRTTPNYLVLQEVRKLPENFTEKFNDKIFPLERGITFVYEKEKGRYDELAVASGVGMEDMLVYIQTQMHLSQYQAPEDDPFKNGNKSSSTKFKPILTLKWLINLIRRKIINILLKLLILK
ncbi:hypothetical protein [Helicobacter pylori]|uniref:hypothetical protein n=1 Tax=Helicobacter pylori TaxID=210 RepID=UPI0013CE3B68|nr:hypothetical protein [Helicobacter pylori]